MCKFHAWSNSGNTHIHHTATDTTVLNNFRLKRNNWILIKKKTTDTMKMMIMNTNTFKSMQISRLALLSKSWVARDQTGLPELILFTAI